MTVVATLVVNPNVPSLSEAHLHRAAAALPNAGPARWLAPGIAADIPFAPSNDTGNTTYRDDLRALFAAEPIDIAVQATALRRKRLLVADMDSTLIGQECIDELADALGLREPVAAITERSMRGEIAFEPALRERVALLGGLPLATVLRIAEERIIFTPGGGVLARTMRAQGAVTAIVSGGFTLFTGRVAAALGFESHFANTLVVEDDKLVGTVEEPILDRDAKRRILQSLCYAHGVALQEALAVGDGANDLAMIEAAGLGVAFRAKPAVAAIADARIDHGDLTALLYFQGYAQAEFAP